MDFSTLNLGGLSLGFHQIVAMQPNKESDYNPDNQEYIDLHNFMAGAYIECMSLENMYERATKAKEFLTSHKLDNGLYNYLCDVFRIDEIICLPRNCITSANQSSYTEICLEGFVSFIADIAKKIWQFFLKLYEAITKFFGIRSFRYRRIEGELRRIKRGLEEMSGDRFHSTIKENVKCSVSTVNMTNLTPMIVDAQECYETILKTKDISNVKALLDCIGGCLTKFGYQVVEDWKIVQKGGLPYQLFEANQTLNIESSFGIKSKDEVYSKIRQLEQLLATTIDVQKWYPMNLKKYAARASVLGKEGNPEQVEEDIKELNEEQKCQAIICKFIVIYLDLVDNICARACATFGSLVAK